MAETVDNPEELGTRYEIHVQNEDGTSNVIVIYSNDDQPAQVQELVTKALAELAKDADAPEQSLIVADGGDYVDPAAMQPQQVYTYDTHQVVTAPESLMPVGMQQDGVMKVEIEMPPTEQQPVVHHKMEEQILKVEIDAPNSSLARQEVYTALKPEELEQMGMIQVENEFTSKSQPYKLEAVDPEELLDIERDISLKKKKYGRRYHMINCDTEQKVVLLSENEKELEITKTEISSPTKVTDDGGAINISIENIPENHESGIVDMKKECVSCSYDECDFESCGHIEYQRHLKTAHNQEMPFKCSFCSKEFKVELSLHIHLLGHTAIIALSLDIPKAKKQFSCMKCDYQCFYKRLLVQHIQDEHEISESDLLTCLKCKVAVLSKEELDVHFKSSMHEENQWSICKICGASSKNISQHMKRMHSDEKPYCCDECGYQCKFSGALKAHLLTHSSERAFKCELCDYSARSKDQLKRHEVVHSSVKDQKCPHCDYATQTIYRLKKHMKIHSNTTHGYHCILCEFATHDKLLLKKHKTDEHSKKLNLSCKDCDLKFGSVQELKVHALAVHKSENSWFCKYCEFSCAKRRELGEHMQVHVGKHRYVCRICGYSCRQSNPFKRHLARHSKVKSFQCKMCSYSCTDKYDLEKHVITHNESKSVNCPECSYTCRYKAQLVRHKKLVHDETKPYFCNFCSYTTKSPQNLKNHMHLHAEKKPFQCVLCDFSACQKSNLKRHMQTHLKKSQIVYVQ